MKTHITLADQQAICAILGAVPEDTARIVLEPQGCIVTTCDAQGAQDVTVIPFVSSAPSTSERAA